MTVKSCQLGVESVSLAICIPGRGVSLGDLLVVVGSCNLILKTLDLVLVVFDLTLKNANVGVEGADGLKAAFRRANTVLKDGLSYQ